MAVDYLKNYLNIDPNDYSAMQSRIAGTPVVDDQFARIDSSPSVNSLRNFGMPQQRSLGDISAMPMMPRQQPVQQDDTKYDGLMAEIASLKAQIEGMQAPTEQVATDQAPVMADEPTEVNMDDARKMFYESPEFKEYQRQTEGMAHTMEYNPSNYTDPTTGNTVSFQDRSGLFQDWYKNTYGRDLTVENRFGGSLDSSLGGFLDESKAIQAPVGIENRAVGEPQPITSLSIDPYAQGDNYVTDDAIYNPTPRRNVFEEAKAPSQDIQASIDYLAKLPKMNIPQIPDMEEIKRKMAEANMSFPEPVNYQDQLQSIRDLPAMNQMPSREQIQMAMQNIPTPVAPVSSMPRFNLPQNQSFGSPRMATGELNIDQGYRPQRMAAGGSLNMALQELKSKLNG